MSNAARPAPSCASLTTPALWGAIGNGELAAGRAVDPLRNQSVQLASRPVPLSIISVARRLTVLPTEKPKPLTSLFCRISAEAIFDRQGSGSLRYGQFVMGSICAPDLCPAVMVPSPAPHYQLLPIRQVMGVA